MGWDGTLYDCDFNLALGLPVNHGVPDHIQSFRPEDLRMRRIITGEHCFGCTAGSGSSCGGNTGIIQKRDDLGINLGAGSSTTFFIDCEL